MSKKIAVTTVSFGEYDPQPVRLLEQNGWEVKFNRYGRTLKTNEIPDFLEGCFAVIAGTENYDPEVLEKLEDLKFISRCGSGTDNVDLKACQTLGIKVFNTPDGPTRAVAELVIGLAINLLRNISAMDKMVRLGHWQKQMGRLFMDKKIGIVGLGHIGLEVAKLSHALGARVFYYDPFVSKSIPAAFAQKCERKDLLAACDIISLHLPLSEENKNFIGPEELGMMKPDALLINCSRGGLVDENALYRALKGKKISGAAVDVFEREPYQGPLQELDNVVLTPHIGSYAREDRVKMELEAVRNLIKGLQNVP